ncbi:DUF3828 domain-containing protein [Flavobacterium sp.]|uniref:DUF3828 domain-containing protein n=1 Tax=Flavobacterium sp. TaxID=239 RepID=UPI003751FFAD
MKQIIKLVLVCFLIISCNGQVTNKNKQDIKQDKKQIENTLKSIETSSDTIVKNLKVFYVSYISENAKDLVDKNTLKELKNKYITKSLLDKLQNLELDYDPFVNAQDYNTEWLKNIEITKDKLKDNTYIIFINDNGTKTTISLVIKKELNEYKIDDINNLPNNIIEPENNENYPEIEVTGSWKKMCEEKKTELLAFDSSHGYLDIYLNNDYARVAIEITNNSNIKYSVLTGITRYNKFVNWLDISHDSTICKVKRTDKSKLELEWFGFYNNKTRKREMVKNPFTDNTQNKSVLLKICE